MSGFVGLVLVLWITVILLIVRSVVNVPAGSAYVVKRLGRFNRVLGPGMHFVIPLIEAVSDKTSTLEQVLDVPPFSSTTADGAAATVRGALRLRISDPAQAASQVADFRKAITQLAAQQWSEALRASATSDALKAVEATEGKIREVGAAWGLEILSASPLLIIEEEPSAANEQSAP